MRYGIATFFAMIIALPFGEVTAKAPEEDQKILKDHFSMRFPDTSFGEYGDGVAAINPEERKRWKEMKNNPAYIDTMEKGEKLFNTPFANGNRYGNCLENGGIAIRHTYPKYDPETDSLKTIESEINRCRIENGEEPLPLSGDDMAAISAYIASTSNGQPIAINIPNEDAQKQYQMGKQIFYARRGQLNISCANCHLDNSGMIFQKQVLSPALGHPTHFPAYKQSWNGLGTLHQQFDDCFKRVQAKPLGAQSEAYKALEYFLNYISNGITVQAPDSRM